MKQQGDVLTFHARYGARVSDLPTLCDRREQELRYRLIKEELDEYKEACEAGDLIGVADALADILYVTLGAFVVHGMDAADLFEEVHASNMTKEGGGKDTGGKILKGPNFKPPDIAKVLMETVERRKRALHEKVLESVGVPPEVRP